MASIFVANMALATAGAAVEAHDPMFNALCLIGQGAPESIFRTLGEEIEREFGKDAALRAMDCLSDICVLLTMGGQIDRISDDQFADLITFIGTRLKTNAARFFPAKQREDT